MNRTTFAMITMALLAFAPARALADFDHLACYKAKDSGKFQALVTLDALQDQFDPLGECKVKGSAALFCVPAEKTVNEFVVDKKPGTLLNVPGPTPVPDRLCYKLKCPKAAINAELVSDQFGTRELAKFKIAMLCTPAVKGLPPTTTTTLGCIPDCAGKTCGDDGCGGQCGACGSGESCCESQCVDLSTDSANCGSCGTVCPGPQSSCAGGQCRCTNCSTGPGITCDPDGSCNCGGCPSVFDPVCGTDGNTYGNPCELSRCPDVQHAYDGECQ